MSYKTIVVHSDDSAAGESRLRFAVMMARRYDAHLVGIATLEPVARPSFAESPHIVELLRLHEQKLKERELALNDAFTKTTRGSGVRVEWRLEQGEPSVVLATAMRYADLGVLGQYQPDGPMSEEWRSLPETVAMTSGRPIVVVPYIGAPQRDQRRVMLAWNASQQATRAASDALPILQGAEKVTVLVVDGSVGGVAREPHGQEPGADVAAWLARHNVKVEVVRDSSAEVDVGSVILSRVSDLDIDLVVMGIYGHSRLRELVMGGASRTMLQQMTVPVLISH